MKQNALKKLLSFSLPTIHSPIHTMANIVNARNIGKHNLHPSPEHFFGNFNGRRLFEHWQVLICKLSAPSACIRRAPQLGRQSFKILYYIKHPHLDMIICQSLLPAYNIHKWILNLSPTLMHWNSIWKCESKTRKCVKISKLRIEKSSPTSSACHCDHNLWENIKFYKKKK